MAFRIEIQPQAFDDLDAIADYILSRHSFEVAHGWFKANILDIATLKEDTESLVRGPGIR